ncbi:MAG: hypothetical protein R3F11_07245 [Verrucomicrobiales bacterium]
MRKFTYDARRLPEYEIIDAARKSGPAPHPQLDGLDRSAGWELESRRSG